MWLIPRLPEVRSEHRRPRPARRPSLEQLEERCVLDGSFGPWGPAVNLDPGTDAVVNSGYSDQHPAISKDGMGLYITTNRPESPTDLVLDDNL
jgi:hypothetical protein